MRRLIVIFNFLLFTTWSDAPTPAKYPLPKGGKFYENNWYYLGRST